MTRTWRAAAKAGAVLAGLAGALAIAAPATADATVDPAVAARGGPARLAFALEEARPGAHTTKVELIAPAATPIAEIYPMSITGWAPLTKMRKLDKPVELIHGSRSTQAIASITWTRVGPSAPNPAQPVVLTVSLGPMPDAEQVAFTLVQTYSDGTVVRWDDPPAAGGAKPKNPAPVVTLVDVGPAPNGHNGGGSHGGTAQQNGSAKPDASAQRPGTKAGASLAVPAEDGGAPPTWLLGAGLLVLLGFVAEGWILFTVDRRAGFTPAARS